MASEFAGTGAPLTQAQFEAASGALKVNDATLWSVVSVETSGFGFLADRRPKILFERHIFHNLTNGQYDKQAPDISNPQPGGYVGGAGEYNRLEEAIALNRQAALESASWGLGQVMGFNAQAAGYADAETMVAAFVAGEGAQLQGVARFILSQSQRAAAIQSRDWATFARLYNGASYAKNQYDTKLAKEYAIYVRGPLPSLDLRAAQAWLTYLGYNTQGVDGLMGRHTQQALKGFQAAAKLPQTGALDPATLSALESRAGV